MATLGRVTATALLICVVVGLQQLGYYLIRLPHEFAAELGGALSIWASVWVCGLIVDLWRKVPT